MKAFFCRFFCTVIFLAALRIEASPRVALMDFSTDDNSYRSALAAADFSALLQVKLKDVDGLEWVERSQLQAAEKELKLSAAGLVSLSAALRVGKFVKADLLVVGQFTSASQLKRVLHLEVIDLEHADVLAETSLPIVGVPNKPLGVSVMDVTAAEKGFRTIIKQALASQSRVKNQTIIAPLFFANTSSSRRLDYLETELQSALVEAAAREGARVLQFPRANMAVEEAELVVAGLVEQDPTAWQKMADVYVWGQYEEAKADGLAFEQTPVTFTLNLWDGSDEVQTLTETVKVSELPQLKERLIKRMLDAAQSFKKRPPRRQRAIRWPVSFCFVLTMFRHRPSRRVKQHKAGNCGNMKSNCWPQRIFLRLNPILFIVSGSKIAGCIWPNPISLGSTWSKFVVTLSLKTSSV